VNIDSSTSVFVPGGSGGVGHFIVQVARIRGAGQIITSASKDEGIQILKEQYKINDVINHATENVVERVLELTQNQGVDIAYDSTYLSSSYAKSIQTVKSGGSWIVLSRFIQDGSEEAKAVAKRNANLVHADLLRYWIGPERAQVKSFVQGSLIQGAKWLEEGILKPYINQIIKLEEAQNVLDQVQQGKSGFGKVVIKLYPN
jgi:NADPH:quinone reductase-like Zn-dependent oxidoreductase